MEQPPQTETKTSIGKIKHIFNFVIKVRWFISAFIALAGFFLLKKFAFDVVRINNYDMAATYHYGDAALVKKIANTYAAGDIAYFEYPAEDTLLARTFVFQRIVGLPGDSIEIANKIVYRNGVLLKDTSTVKHNYFIETKNKRPQTIFKLYYGLTEGGQVSDEFDYSYSLTKSESEALSKDTAIKSVNLKAEKKSSFDETCFPWNANYKWNMDYFGKVYIPKINDTLKLDSVSINLYHDLIYVHEKNNLEVRRDSILINGALSRYYVVKKNYYFVLGDNRDNANDSRSWGFLPENRIVGKIIGLVRRK